MILILEYEGETTSSKAGILADATNIGKRLGAKNQSTLLCKTMTEFQIYMTNPSSKNEDKLHIVCHGNRNQVGDYNGAKLAAMLWDAGLDKRPKINRITIHSCESGMERVNPENNSWTPPIIWQVAAFFAEKRRNIVVKGAEGETITDSMGHGFVLNPGASWQSGVDISRERELFQISQTCQAKGMARPKYATYDGSAPDLV